MAKNNFDACLREILKHEGGFVNHPRLDTLNKMPYNQEWSTQKSLQKASTLPFSKKVYYFIKRLHGKTPDHTPVKLMDALMMHLQVGCVTHITLGNAKARICLRRSDIAAKKINVWSVIVRSMGRVAGLFAKVIITKGDGQSYERSALKLLVDAARNVVKNIRTTFTTFITLVSKKKILPLVIPLKVLELMQSLRKSPSAFYYAPIVIG